MTQTLKAGDRGALVALLQLALERAGQMPGALDGIFGAQTAAAVRAFQAANALVPDGIAGAQTHRALLPYYTGFVLRTVRAGDTFSALAQQYGTSVEAIRLANPHLDPERLPIGRAVTVPLPFPVTPVRIPYSSALIGYVVRGLAARYPTLAIGEFGRSVLGKPLWYLTLGSGKNACSITPHTTPTSGSRRRCCSRSASSSAPGLATAVSSADRTSARCCGRSRSCSLRRLTRTASTL